MIRAVVFDFGNVVGFFDHRKTLARLQPYTDWPAGRIYEEIYAGPLEDALESGRMSVDEFLAEFVRRCELRCDADYVRKACQDIFTPNPAVVDLVPRLAGRCRLALGSNTNPIHAEQFLLQFADVLKHFDHLVLSYAIGVRKPKTEFFRQCAARAECQPRECVFIDDLAENVAGATAIGMHGVVYRPQVDLPEELRRLGVQIGS